MSRGRSVIFSAIVLLLPICALLTAIWIVSYRAVPRAPVLQEGDPLISYDPEIGFVPRPNSRSKRTHFDGSGASIATYHLYTDRRGARVTTPGDQSPTAVDIVAIGDSHTWGHGVENENTFANLAMRGLGATGANLAMGSYGTAQALQILRRNRDLSPKLVIYAIIADHLQRNIMPCAPSYYPFCFDTSHVVWESDGTARIAPPYSDGVTRMQRQIKWETGWLDPVTWIVHGADVVWARIPAAWGRKTAQHQAKQNAGLEFLLKEMAQTVSELKARLLVVFIPTGSNSPPPALLRSVAALELPFLDLSDAFRDYRDRGGIAPLYIPNDGHPSLAGHALIAEHIVSYVRREGLLAPSP